MCDYSLMGVPNRLANEGEDLIVCRFSTGTIGLTEAPSPATCPSVAAKRRIWSRIWDFVAAAEVHPSAVAVCIPPGTRLLLGDIAEDLRRTHNIGSVEEVTFTQLSAAENTHRDAIRLLNGKQISLQQLRAGQRVRVLQLTLPEEVMASARSGRSIPSSIPPTARK
jgi:hypothetical protein